MHHRYIGDKAFYRRVIGVAVPIIIQNGITNFVSLLDNIMVGQVGTVPMSGVSIVNGLLFVFNLCVFGASSGAGIFTAQFYGSKDDDGIRHTFRFKFLICIVISLVGAAIFLLGGSSLIGLYLTGEGDAATAAGALDHGLKYLAIMLWGFLPFALTNTYSSTLRETGETFIPMLGGIAAVFVNLVLNYILIFGKLGCPALGIAGAAIASSAAELVSLLFFAIYTRLKGNPRRYRLFRFRGVNFRELGLIFNVSIWTMMQAFISTATWFLFFLAVEHLGERQLAISNIVRSLSSILFVTISAFGSTTSALVSTLMGRGEPKLVMPTVWQIVRMSYWAALPVMALMALFPSLVLHIYTGDQSLISASIASLWVMVAIYFTLIPSNMLFCAVSGTGNTRAAMLMELVALAVYVAAIWQIIIVHRPDIAVCWTVDHIYSIVLLLFTYLYLTKANWQNKKI